MAISSAMIPELWSAALYRELNQENLWLGNVTDVSSEFPGYGDKVNVASISTTPTISDLTVGTALADAEQPTDAEVTLTLSQKKYFHTIVHDLNEIQTRPNVMEDWARKAGVAINKAIDSYIYGVWSAGTIPATQKVSQTELKNDLSSADAKQKEFVINLLKLVKIMDDQNWPSSGRWMMIPTKAKFYILQYLLTTGRIGSGSLNDSAAVNGAIDQLFGVRVRTTAAITNSDTSNHIQAIGGISSGVYFAQQVSQIESYRPEAHFADAIKGLFVYGAVLMDGKRRVAVTHA